MTDEGLLDEAPRDEVAARPVPLPVGGPPSAKRPIGLWVTMAIVVVALVSCGAAYLIARWIGDSLDDLPDPGASIGSPLLSSLRTPASAWWAGNGDYAVMQAVAGDDRPIVSVWNRATGDVRTLRGYRVTAVEPHAPRIWLVPDERTAGLIDDSQLTTATLMDIAWDGVDAPPSELYALRLDSEGDPRSDVDARWTAWDGPAGYTVSVEMDVNKGACASTLRFDKVHSSLNAWAAKVPTDVATFEPIGWSPSGLYFAVISQADVRTAQKSIDRYLARQASGEPAQYTAALLVFDARDGSLAARDDVVAPLHDPNSGPAVAAWGGPGDSLYHFDLDYSFPTLEVLTLDGKDTYVDPEGDAWVLGEGTKWIAGVDDGAPLVALGNVADMGTDIYRVAEKGPLHEGLLLGQMTARWSPSGGMLSVESFSWSGGLTAYVSDLRGGRRRLIDSVVGPEIEPTD